MFTKTLSFIKNIKFKWSDLLFLIAAVFTIVISIEGTRLMGTISPKDLSMPIWLINLFFALGISSFGFGLFLERKNQRSAINIIALFVIFILILINCLVIFLQPNAIKSTYPNPNGDPFELLTEFSSSVKLVYFYNFAMMLLVFYIALFVLPKRLSSKTFVLFVTICLIIFGLFTIVFSLFKDFKNYGLLFQGVFSSNISYQIESVAPKSIFHHRNIFGTFLEITIYVSMIAYSLSKRKSCFFLMGIFYLFLLLTLCKTGIILSSVSILIWVFLLLFKKYKNNKANLIKSLSIYMGIILSLAIALILMVVLSPSINAKVNKLFSGGDTLIGRLKIWKNTIVLIHNYAFIGRGYGVYNSLLLHVNTFVLADKTFSSHSFIFSTLGRGGIIALLSFLAILGYGYYTISKKLKSSSAIWFTFIIVLTSMVLHNLLEDNYYTIIVMLSAIFIIYNYELKTNNAIQEINKKEQE